MRYSRDGRRDAETNFPARSDLKTGSHWQKEPQTDDFGVLVELRQLFFQSREIADGEKIRMEGRLDLTTETLLENLEIEMWTKLQIL